MISVFRVMLLYDLAEHNLSFCHFLSEPGVVNVTEGNKNWTQKKRLGEKLGRTPHVGELKGLS